MKVVVVDDCSHVMADIIPFLDKDIEVQSLSRTRGLWSKTFGVAWKILCSKGDVYHVNYGLQNAWLTGKLKHLDIVHFHGSDIRWTINSKRYGWLVKYALENAGKVLYATPDLEMKIKKYRSDAIYIPTPINTNEFSLKQNYNKKPKALYFRQWYENINDYSKQLQLIKGFMDVTVKERTIPYSIMPDFLKTFDVFIDRFSIPSYSKTCLEAMSCGLATVDFKNIQTLTVEEIRQIGLENHLFVKEYHDAVKVAKILSVLYKEVAF
jgi:hypothetical protein